MNEYDFFVLSLDRSKRLLKWVIYWEQCANVCQRSLEYLCRITRSIVYSLASAYENCQNNNQFENSKSNLFRMQNISLLTTIFFLIVLFRLCYEIFFADKTKFLLTWLVHTMNIKNSFFFLSYSISLHQFIKTTINDFFYNF